VGNKVVIINHGLSNLNSITRALEECGGDVLVTENPADLATADRIVLPGVGSFPAGMARLINKGLGLALKEELSRRSVPVLGICLGMQLMADASEEGGHTLGLGVIPGKVVRLIPTNDERIPHIGWNAVYPTKNQPLFDGIPNGTDFYFVHSYHLHCPEPNVVARTPFCGNFTAVASIGSVTAVQFHPEKSQKPGFRLLTNFLAM
jgi:glutamine amidotransferase